ncbi:MAG: S41 family peptidase [Sphingomonadaceae bacterium]|mgnify:CR=1 FL=1
MKLVSMLHSALLLGAVSLIPATTAGLAAVDGRSSEQFSRLELVYAWLKAYYVEPTEDGKLEDGAIEGMLSSLDPHSSYLSGASIQRLNNMIDGEYQGLGLSVVMDDGAVKVVAPMRGSPGEAAGIKAGDYITHIDGKLIYGGELDDAVAQMRGPAGTKIRLTIFRSGREQPFDVTVTRGVIKLEPVTWELKDNVGVITVNEFGKDVGESVAKGIADLKLKSGGKLEGLVLDLRQNPGGELEEAVALSDVFLTKGDIVSQRGRNSREDQYFRAETMFPGDLAKGLPLIVLIDEGSASASEIVAGALQDQHRALIMGQRSFGKGSVQSLFYFDRSRSSGVKFTTARYYTPSGRSVQEGGIDPDIRVPQLSDPDAARRSELTARESDLRRHLVNEAAMDDKKLESDRQADPHFKETPDTLKAKGIKDFQMFYAIQTVHRTAAVKR